MSVVTIDSLKEELSLTDAQCKKLKPLLNKVRSLFESMKNEMGKPDKYVSLASPRATTE